MNDLNRVRELAGLPLTESYNVEDNNQVNEASWTKDVGSDADGLVKTANNIEGVSANADGNTVTITGPKNLISRALLSMRYTWDFSKYFSEEASVTEAGGHYTQPVYDMIEKHGIDKVMHELLTSLDADTIQDFISRADLDETTDEEIQGL